MVFNSPAVITREILEKTRSIAGKIAFFNSFNNASFVSRVATTYTVRASRFAAEGIARGGFTVTLVEGTTDMWTVVRAYGVPVV